jgi:hypothetical protein
MTAHAWGTLDVMPAGRALWSSTRLTVYPPGTNVPERRLLHAADAWPWVGLLTGILVVAAASALPLGIALVVGLAYYAAGYWFWASVTKRLRHRVRRVVVSVINAGDHRQVLGDAQLLNAAARALSDLDQLVSAGALTPVEYEALWADVYESLPCEEKALAA